MFDVAKFERKLQDYHKKKSIGRKDCKDYLILLAHLSHYISKDAKSYASVALITKKWIAGFKPIFGKVSFNKYSSIITVTCFKLLKSFRQFEPKHSYQFYCDWRDIMQSSTSSKRAETFIKYIREFANIVEHLQATENRWDQLVILGILRVYTKKVKLNDIKELKLEGCDAFLDIIQKIIPLQHHKQASIRMNNSFLNDLNSMDDKILSFQPYKIYFDNFTYIVTDYDLWLDFSIKTKTITFVALSVVNKFENVYGVTSTTQMQIVSHQDNTISIKNNWNLSMKNEFIRSDGEVEIVFCFSSRVHNSILESKLKNVFNVIQLKKHVLSKNSFLKTVLGVNTSRMADESMLSSNNEIRLVGELEKLHIPEQPKDRIIQEIIQPALNKENTGFNDGGQVTDMIQTVQHASKTYVHHPAANNSNVNDAGLTMEDSKIGTENPLVTYKKLSTHSSVVKKRFLKRRRDRVKQGDCSSTDTESNEPSRDESYRKHKRACKRLTNSKTKKEQLCEKLIMKKSVSDKPSLIIEQASIYSPISNSVVQNAIPRTVTMKEPKFEMIKPVKRSPDDKKYVKIIADEVLRVADDSNQISNILPTPNKNDEEPKNHAQCFPQVSNQLCKANTFVVEQINKQNIHRSNDPLLPLCQRCATNNENYLDYNFYRQCWIIRKFIKSLEKEEQEYVEENPQPIDDDMKSTDVYESVSQQ